MLAGWWEDHHLIICRTGKDTQLSDQALGFCLLFGSSAKRWKMKVCGPSDSCGKSWEQSRATETLVLTKGGSGPLPKYYHTCLTVCWGVSRWCWCAGWCASSLCWWLLLHLGSACSHRWERRRTSQRSLVITQLLWLYSQKRKKKKKEEHCWWDRAKPECMENCTVLYVGSVFSLSWKKRRIKLRKLLAHSAGKGRRRQFADEHFFLWRIYGPLPWSD